MGSDGAVSKVREPVEESLGRASRTLKTFYFDDNDSDFDDNDDSFDLDDDSFNFFPSKWKVPTGFTFPKKVQQFPFFYHYFCGDDDC